MARLVFNLIAFALFLIGLYRVMTLGHSYSFIKSFCFYCSIPVMVRLIATSINDSRTKSLAVAANPNASETKWFTRYLWKESPAPSTNICWANPTRWPPPAAQKEKRFCWWVPLDRVKRPGSTRWSTTCWESNGTIHSVLCSPTNSSHQRRRLGSSS